MQDAPPAGQENIREVHHYHDRRGFNFGRFFLGLILVLIGFLYFARAAGWVPADFSLDWSAIWPLLIIVLGLSMLTRGGWLSGMVGGIVTLLVIAAIILLIIGGQSGGQEVRSQDISIERDSAAARAEVTVKTGAGTIDIAGGTDQLAEGTLESNILSVERDVRTRDGVQVAKISTTGSWRGWGRLTNDLRLKLNENLPLKLSLDVGAARSAVDLSAINSEAVDINMGASSLDLALGNKPDSASVNVKAGASSVHISVPESSGVRLHIVSGISSRELTGFIKTGDRDYETEGYDSASKKINIDANLGAASFSIVRR